MQQMLTSVTLEAGPEPLRLLLVLVPILLGKNLVRGC